MTLVWRTKPVVYAVPSTFEADADTEHPYNVKVCYRMHALNSTDDATLDRLKTAQFDREFGQPHHGHYPDQEAGGSS
jgi:hypothetical protein